MKQAISILGDSHAGFWVKIGDRYDHGKDFTTQRLCDESYSPIWQGLDAWLRTRADTTLLLCCNEVDMRGHYWRHLPRSGKTTQQFVNELATVLYNRCCELADRYSLTRVVLWGAPPACSRTNNNHHWPFVGSVCTRNRLIEQFNREFIKIAVSSGRDTVGFSTAFYEFLDSDSWFAVNHRPTDGVHWDGTRFDDFHELIKPVLEGNQLVSIMNHTHYDQIGERTYRIARREREEINILYDNWIDRDLPAVTDAVVEFEGCNYRLVSQKTIEHAQHQQGAQHGELCLIG